MEYFSPRFNAVIISISFGNPNLLLKLFSVYFQYSPNRPSLNEVLYGIIILITVAGTNHTGLLFGSQRNLY